MYHVESDRSVLGQHQYRCASTVIDENTASDDVKRNWYFWSKLTAAAAHNDYTGTESITTVYAVKTAIGQQRYTGTCVW